MGKRLTESQKLRLQADRLDAEAAAAAAKPPRKTCDTCGQRIPWTEAERAKVEKAMEPVRELRQKERLARESE